MFNSIKDRVKERKVILASHGGYAHANIPFNSIEGYLIADNYDADIVEMDVNATADGKLFMLHPHMELWHLGWNANIQRFNSDELPNVKLANQVVAQTQYSLATFEETLNALKPRKCLLNIDKFWLNPDKIADAVRKAGMEDRVLLKSDPTQEVLDIVEKYCPEMQFMAIIRTPEEFEEAKKRKLNLVGVEILFDSDNQEICSKKFIDKLHNDGYITWANAIVYNYKTVIAADHTDDNSLLYGGDKGWGWLAERGFDIIQTDWLSECNAYLKSHSYRF